MSQDWNAYRTEVMNTVGAFAKQSPDTLRGLMTMDGAGEKTGHLTPKLHELISARCCSNNTL